MEQTKQKVLPSRGAKVSMTSIVTPCPVPLEQAAHQAKHSGAALPGHLVIPHRRLTATIFWIHPALIIICSVTVLEGVFNMGLYENNTKTKCNGLNYRIQENARRSLIIPTPNTTEQTLHRGILVSSFNVSTKVDIFRQLSENDCSQLNSTVCIIQALLTLLQRTRSILTTFVQEQLPY